ncbi:hypothetical protein I302_109171 [Kwoniella bestiolae CBS 10118]|uniref:CNNM transmembrane domain-containing protein n=1 Tax=Kwoniella bestiolae CBS 10118 TaxID=1296100 RepID=A0A1B9FV71_9TREE|nr:hypothetical protein I302_08317 [Kwoniella bestiolae CBS 10118]OCF22666.1 hypothetical protein I302_08317 [Kwoniella bestiolae CBS 10118]
MIEETPTEPPPPPDIRPFGCITGNNNDKHNRLNSDYYTSTLPLGGVENTHTAASRDEGYRFNPSSRSRSRWGITLKAANMFIPLIMLFLLASTVSASPTSQMADSYTSYDVPFLSDMGSSKRKTPILSFFKYILDSASTSLSHFTNDSNTGKMRMMGKRELSTGEIVEACMIPVLVALSGMFAGLTLGYFSVDPTQLQVLSISGTPTQQKYAMKILPVRKDSHLLLTTLILGNMIVNEALPVVMDNVIGGGIYAVIASTALVVIFAEIIPQSICSRYGLLVGASMAWPVRIMIWIAFPIAWPIAKLLEYILGAHHGIIYRRSELRELIKMHAATAEGGGDLDFDTVQMAQGALDLAQKTVKQAMTPIEQVFMLPIEAKLDYETLGHVVRSGHSRIPVYQMVEVPDINLAAPTKGPGKTKMVKKVLGSLLVKSCVLLDPEDATPLASIPINAIPSVPYDEPLTNMLNVFQEGRSHMAIVSRRPKRVEKDLEDAESVMTAAAGGLRQRFMRKVAEISHGNKSSSDSDSSETDTDVERGEKGEGNKKRRKKRRTKRINSGSDGTAVASSPTSTSAAEEIKNQQTQEQERKKKASLVEKAKLTQLEQTVPADAQMAPGAVEKFFEGLEGAPLGVITLEDVLEELIGEEIYDEYDEHGVPRSDASAFVPREAMLAARQAALARQNLALAESTPLPSTNDADLDQQPSTGGTRRTMIPKLTMTKPKFSLGKKPVSQPGRSRTVDEPKITAATPPLVSQPQLPSHDAPSSSLVAGSEIRRTSSPSEIIQDQNDAPRRTQSEVKINARRQSTPTEAQLGANVPLKGLDPVTAVPARLLSGGGAVTPNIAPPSGTNLLSEALMIERGRRRGGTNTPPILRAVSQGAVKSTPSSRQTTPPTSSTGQTSTSSAPAGAAGGGILSPQPVQAKKVPKFKSVPAPLVSTPAPSERASMDWKGERKSEGKE